MSHNRVANEIAHGRHLTAGVSEDLVPALDRVIALLAPGGRLSFAEPNVSLEAA